VKGRRIQPPPITAGKSVTKLVEDHFLAYNGGRLREAAGLLARKMLADEKTIVGLSLTGAMTPAGIGMSCLVPLIEGGYVDYFVSTGANLYHDIHHGLDLGMFASTPFQDDRELRRQGLVRIYDILFDYDVLLKTDEFIYRVIDAPGFQRTMGTAEFHYLLGRAVDERARALGASDRSVVASAFRAGVPIYTSSPGDSSIGMNVAARRLEGIGPIVDPSIDVNETTAIVLHAKSVGGKSGVLIVGGGSPKNFLLQTEPQLQEVLKIAEGGHDYFIQITDARPDTGGLSGATPAEAYTWGKVSEEGLPAMVVCYVDATVALPILTAYVLENCPPRPLKRLYDRRGAMMDALREAARRARAQEAGG
jgi:deoxyhypusine synthase